MIWYYFLIGLGFTFIVEVSTKHYAEEIRIINGDERDIQMERIYMEFYNDEYWEKYKEEKKKRLGIDILT